MKKKLLLASILFMLLVCARQTCAGVPCQSDPMTPIKGGTEKALQILHDSQRRTAPSLRQRKNEILEIVSAYFNFEEMAKRALGRPWKDQTPEKRLEFVQLFRQLLFNTYISRLESYTGSNERVSYDSQNMDGEYALVKTHISSPGSDSISLDYRLRNDGGEWKVYDVVVEGVSFVDNYRSQFSSILSNGSFDSLLGKLREKVNE